MRAPTVMREADTRWPQPNTHPIHDDGGSEYSTPEQSRRGWHKYRRLVYFPVTTPVGDIEAYALSLKAADRGMSMWWSYTIRKSRACIETPLVYQQLATQVLEIDYGHDSGD